MAATQDHQSTKAELEQEVLNLRAGQENDAAQAREWLQKKVNSEIEFWYLRAREIALNGSPQDQVRYLMTKCILDKLLPDKKELTRGAATVGSPQVQINIGAKAKDGETPSPAIDDSIPTTARAVDDGNAKDR